MTIIENESDRVVSDLLDIDDVDVFLAQLQDFLPGTVASHFRRRGKDSQVLTGQFKSLSIVKRYLQHPGLLMQFDIDGLGTLFRHMDSVRRAYLPDLC